MTTETRLSKADRAALCARVDLPAMLAADGVQVRRNGRGFICSLRKETAPSCHVYPPGTGRKGADGWTLKDYGDGWGGDALGYLIDKRGLPFSEALGELCQLAGWTPKNLEKSPVAYAVRNERRPTLTRTPPGIDVQNTPFMTTEKQFTAACAFIGALCDLYPDADKNGKAYISSRGCLPAGCCADVFHLPADICKPLIDRLADDLDAPALKQAGLLITDPGKPPRLPWWTECALFVCRDTEAGAVYFVGRRLDYKPGDRVGKYLNQPCNAGAVRWPFNLPALYHAAGHLPAWPVKTTARELLIVEGPLDALGAAVLGWPAVAMLNRPQAYDYQDNQGAAPRMLEPHLPALRDVGRVLIVPDADPGKQEEGEALAARLAGWLTFAGVRAEVATLADLCPDAPTDCKDLADIANKRKINHD